MSGDDKIFLFLLLLTSIGLLNTYVTYQNYKRALSEFPADRVPEILQLLKTNKHLDALKRIREITFWELLRAKDYLEDLKQKHSIN